MKVLWFAWLRAKTGIGEEKVDPPEGVATVADHPVRAGDDIAFFPPVTGG